MAWTPDTGYAMKAAFGATLAAYPGMRRITISETAAPLPEMLDQTKATDSAYAFGADPLGAKGSASTVVTIEGLCSKSDYGDSGVIADALNTAGDLLIHPQNSTSTYNLFTLTAAEFVDYSRSDNIREWATYTARLELESTGAWTAV